MTAILAFDPERRTSARAIADLVTLGYLNRDQAVLDMTYGKGRFWREWRPRFLTTNDINPERHALFSFDFCDMPCWDGLFDVTAFDPPFKLNGTGGRGPGDEAYGVEGRYQSLGFIIDQCEQGFSEAVRVTKPRGLILYKTQNQISGGRSRRLAAWMEGFAEEKGCRFEDELYICGHRAQPNGRPQRHARNNVSVIQVYRKMR
jgi:hypothetical protein